MILASSFDKHPDVTGSNLEHGIRAASEQLGASSTKPKPMVEWQKDPIGWAEKFLGIPSWSLRWTDLEEHYEGHEWDGTPDAIAAMFEAIAAGKDVGVEAGTGTSKSYSCAVLTLWFLACWEDSRVATYAPKEDQLRKYMWSEIQALWPRFQALFPTATISDLRIRMWRGDKWGASGVSVAIRAGETSATKAQGVHSAHMLLIVEETPGVPEAIMTALENTRTGDHNIQICVGNPDGVEDPLHKWCTRPWVEHIRISALDYPNVVAGEELIPGAVTHSKVERRKVLYKDRPAMYDSRVRGISPEYKAGLALRFRADRHMLIFDEAMHEKALEEGWKWYGGIDFGAWRFAFVLGAVDRSGRLWLLDEYFSGFGVSLSDRARDIHELLERWGVPEKAFTLVGDTANQTDIIEINRAWRVMGSWCRVGAASMAAKARAAAVEKLNDLLAVMKLTVRRGIGAELEWKRGATSMYQGDDMQESRLLWEIRNWAYEEPGEGKAQKEDPLDDSADGADAIAALRYLVMTWLKAAGFEKPKPKPRRNVDLGLEKLSARYKKELKGLGHRPF